MNKDPIDLAAHRKQRARRQNARDLDQVGNSGVTPKQTRSWFHRASSKPLVHQVLGHGEVPCVRCQAPLAGNAKRCLHCGLHYSGNAEEFAPRKTRSFWFKLVIVILLLAFLFSAFAPLLL